MSYKAEPALPEIDHADHLISYLLDVGPVAGDGGAIAYSELAHWQGVTGYRLTGWEASTLRELSIVYANQSTKARDKNSPAPWTSAPVDRDAVASRLAAAFDRIGDRQRG